MAGSAMRRSRAPSAGLVGRGLMEGRQRLLGLGAQRVPLRGQDQRAGRLRRAAGQPSRPGRRRQRARVAAGQALQGGFVQAQRRLFQ